MITVLQLSISHTPLNENWIWNKIEIF